MYSHMMLADRVEAFKAFLSKSKVVGHFESMTCPEDPQATLVLLWARGTDRTGDNDLCLTLHRDGRAWIDIVGERPGRDHIKCPDWPSANDKALFCQAFPVLRSTVRFYREGGAEV